MVEGAPCDAPHKYAIHEYEVQNMYYEYGGIETDPRDYVSALEKVSHTELADVILDVIHER